MTSRYKKDIISQCYGTDMPDYYYPLPKEKLIKRYAPLFDVIKKRQSGCFIGLPESAKSGYLQFLLEEKKIIKSLLPGFQTKHKILYFEPIPVITDNPYHWLFQLSMKLEILDEAYEHIVTEDPVIVLTNIQKYLLSLAKKNSHLSIILSRPSVWDKLPKEVGYALKDLWETKRQPPKNPCSLTFLQHSKSPEKEIYAEFYSPLQIALHENILFFPVLDKEEVSYTINRFCNFLELNLPNASKKLLYEVSGGFYPLITNSLKVLKSQNQKITPGVIKSLSNNKLVLKTIKRLWKSFEDTQQNELIKVTKEIKAKDRCNSTLQSLGIVSKECTVSSPWIQSYIAQKKYQKHTGVSPKTFLKGKEFVVFKHFEQSQGELVTRDEIAEILWNHETREKYSDWAIDKTISRIRKKLAANNTACSIITIKKQGYVLLS